MSDETCEHIARGETSFTIRILDKQTGKSRLVCRKCSADFVRSLGHEPHMYAIGYNLYRSYDPNIPKNQWQKVNPTPVPKEELIDKGANRPDPDADVYYYITVVNAYGIESNPSNVIGPNEVTWDIPDATDFEM